MLPLERGGDRHREAFLVELVLGEYDPSVRTYQDAPRHPTARQPPKQRAVWVGDDGKRQPVLALPLLARLRRFERTDVDDLETFGAEALEDTAYDRSLLSTSLSQSLPEDDERGTATSERQAQLARREPGSRLDPPAGLVEDFHDERSR